jgi:hypothetical protein
MNWSAQVFNYCERGANPAFWAEPLNALSNIAFLIASAAALLFWRRLPRADQGREELALIAIVGVIGAGSFLFHTLATRWSILADTIPIVVFMLATLAYVLRRLIRLPVLAVIACLAAFMGTLMLAGQVRCGGGACLNGSVGYLPALGMLALTGFILFTRHNPAGSRLLTAAVVFAVSLTLRTFDQTLCPFTLIANNWQTGTHALWHMLNALVLYLLLMMALKHRAA